jgi:hypothetical protein
MTRRQANKRRYYERHRAAVLLQDKMRHSGVRLSIAACREELARDLPVTVTCDTATRAKVSQGSRRRANKAWYRRNRRAVILQVKARGGGIRLTMAECRAAIAAKVEKAAGTA